MIEAMACGTPVIAWQCGSVREIVDHGETGFIVTTEDEALAAVRRLPLIDRRGVRAQFERRFTASVMARNYLKLYWRLHANSNRQRRIPAPVGGGVVWSPLLEIDQTAADQALSAASNSQASARDRGTKVKIVRRSDSVGFSEVCTTEPPRMPRSYRQLALDERRTTLPTAQGQAADQGDRGPARAATAPPSTARSARNPFREVRQYRRILTRSPPRTSARASLLTGSASSSATHTCAAISSRS